MKTRKEKQIHRVALQICIDWMNSDDFKVRANTWKLIEASTLWNQLKDARKTSGFNHDKTERLFIRALDYAEEQDWIKRERTTLGRPRIKSYSPNEREKAIWQFNHPSTAESTKRRVRSVAEDCQSLRSQVITLQDSVLQALTENAPTGTIEGCSRDDLQTLFQLNPRATNALWRWLQQNGWKEKRTTRGVKRVRVIHRELL